MRFGSAVYAYGFWLVAALVLFFLWARAVRKKNLELFAQAELLPVLTSEVDTRARFLKMLLVTAALLLAVFSSMRPQWGYQWQRVTRTGLDIFVAVDVSKSMLAVDIKPNRLQRVRLGIQDLVATLQGDRIGLIAFAGTAFVQCPLTVDYGGFLLALNDVGIDSIPRGGTSLANAIRAAIQGFEGTDKKYRILIIATDGEDHEGDLSQAVKEAKAAGVRIFCLGIGTPEGELIRLTDETGGSSFLKDKQGNVVKSRLDESALQEIALATQGGYMRATAADFGLDTLYREQIAVLEARQIKAQREKLYYERFQLPLAAALLLLMLEVCISESRKR